MPTVPTYGLPKVAPQARPGVRVNTNVPSEAFAGAPLPDLSGIEPILNDYVTDQKRKADQIAVTDAEGQLANFETSTLYDPNNGLLTRKGKDAFEASQQLGQAWDTQVSLISNTLGNDDQKRAFSLAATQRRSNVNEIVQRHVASEIQNYDAQASESAINNERAAAIASYNDPERIGLSIERQAKWITEFGRRNGMPDAQIAEEVNKAVSQTHVGVISRMLANDQDLDAKAYYDKHKKELYGADTVNVEKSLDEGSTRGESQRQADQIVRKYPDRDSALEAAAKIKDPKVRDMTEDRINAFFSRKRQAMVEQREDLYMQSTNIIDARPGAQPRDVIPPHVWSKLTLDQRSALERRAKGEDMPNNDKVWLQFLDMRPSELGKMSQAAFETDYWSHLDGPHRERAALQWAAARDAVEKNNLKNAQISNDLDFKQRVTISLRKAGLINGNKPIGKLNTEQTQLFSQFELEATHRIEQFELTKGKRATGDEKQKIIDGLLVDKVFLDRSFRADPEVPLFYVQEDQQSKAYIPVDKIPQPDLEYMKGLIRRNGTPLTNDKLQRAYAAYKLNNRALMDSILSEK